MTENREPDRTRFPEASRKVLRRRDFVRLAIALTGGVALVVWQVPQRARKFFQQQFAARRDPLLGRCAPALFGSTEVERIGRAYLVQVPSESTRAALLEFLSGSDGAALTCEKFSDTIRQAVARDFDSGDLVSVEQWTLPRTECRLCALATVS